MLRLQWNKHFNSNLTDCIFFACCIYILRNIHKTVFNCIFMAVMCEKWIYFHFNKNWITLEALPKWFKKKLNRKKTCSIPFPEFFYSHQRSSKASPGKFYSRQHPPNASPGLIYSLQLSSKGIKIQIGCENVYIYVSMKNWIGLEELPT